MFTRWQLVLLGLVVSQGLSLSASEKAKSSPRTPLSCSEEARKMAAVTIVTLNRLQSELRKESSSDLPKKGSSNPVNIYYDTPCGSGRVISCYENQRKHGGSPLAPWADFLGL